jgi:hypothetical protein
MRIYIAVAVFAFGVWCYAVAALLFDRRRILRNWQAGRRARASGGAQVAAVRAVSARPLYLTIVGCLVGGTVLMLGSCAGLILW